MSKDHEQLQHRVIQYLYGEISLQEREQFERDLQNDPALGEVFEAEKHFDSVLPSGSQPVIDEERLQGNRWALRQRLQRESRKGFSVQRWLQQLMQRPLALTFQAGAMAATFVLGLMVATPSGVVMNSQDPLLAADGSAQSPLRLVGDDEYEIFQLKVNSFDPSTGEIDLTFALASETQLIGNVADESISSLMAVALQDELDTASRLDTVMALQAVASGNQVYQALIHVLNTDQNPGVRYQAVQALTSLAHEEAVRDALRTALSDDVNPGVRVEAFQALAGYRDDETLSVFRQRMDSDSNEYIRAQSRAIVEQSEADSIDL